MELRQAIMAISVHQFEGGLIRLGRMPTFPTPPRQFEGPWRGLGRGGKLTARVWPAPRKGGSTLGIGACAHRWPTTPNGSSASGDGCKMSLAARLLRSAWPPCADALQSVCRSGGTVTPRRPSDMTNGLQDAATLSILGDLRSARRTVARLKRVLTVKEAMVGRQLKTLKCTTDNCTDPEFMPQLARRGPQLRHPRPPLTLVLMG